MGLLDRINSSGKQHGMSANDEDLQGIKNGFDRRHDNAEKKREPFTVNTDRSRTADKENSSAEDIRTLYEQRLDALVAQLHDRAEFIENKIENLIERANVDLERQKAQKPGVISTPKARKAWSYQVERQENRIRTLRNRLESIHEIKEGIGPQGPHLLVMANKQLRFRNPVLASKMDSYYKQDREEQLKIKKPNKTKKRVRKQSRARKK